MDQPFRGDEMDDKQPCGENPAEVVEASQRAKGPSLKLRFALLAILLFGGLIAFKVFDLGQYIGCDALHDHRQDLLAYVAAQRLTAIALFILLYVVVTAFSLPVATLVTIAGGFLFGTLQGTVMVVLAATLGATLLFIVAKTLLGDALREKAGPRLDKMAKGFEENAFSYLMVLRLVPLFPFWLVNVAPAFMGVRLPTFFLATLLGIVPGTFVYVSVGAGLGSIFDAGAECSLTGIFTPQVLIALIGLAVLALIPLIYKKLKARRGGTG